MVWMISVSNTTTHSLYEQNTIQFWAFYTIYMLIGITALVGNALVILVTYGNYNSGNLRYLDSTIKSLALADMLFGLLGVPCRVAIDYKVGRL